MRLKVWIKTQLADKALIPLRQELVSLIETGAKVLDVGCGSGHFLLLAQPKISMGLGIDIDGSLIQFAQERCRKQDMKHIHFDCMNALDLAQRDFDVSSSTLCLHELSQHDACLILTKLSQVSKRILIADYGKPKRFGSKIAIELDECISGHYFRFRAYRQCGGIEEYARRCGLFIHQVRPSSIDGIYIWDIRKANK